MKILKTIGNFFVKIWRWIKNTAWVQPLLIVGAIFGVIFSIPAITSGIQGLINTNNSADKFYEGYKKTLEGNENSPAQKLFNNYYNHDTNKTELPKDELKYFVMFTAKNNSTANEIKPGFEVLRDNWNSTYAPVEKDYPFKLYTIYTDEVTTATKTNLSAFAQFMRNMSWFFERASEVGLASQYYYNKGITKSDLEKMGSADPDNFINPTIILVDWTGKTTTRKGITQVMFNVTGSNSYDKANLLRDCWNCQGLFKKDK